MDLIKKTKRAATKEMNRKIFENFEAPADIKIEIDGQHWIRSVWKNPSGKFGWDKWKRVF